MAEKKIPGRYAGPNLIVPPGQNVTKVFPFGIIYQIKKEELLIVAVAVLNREPEY